MKITVKMNKKAVLFTCLIFLFFGRFAFAMNDLPYSQLGRRISMDFKDASLKDVLKIFSQQSGLNFVASKDIEDTNLTLYMENVTVQQALDKLLGANELIYDLEPQNNIFIVKRSVLPEIKTITKVFYLKFAHVPGSRLAEEITQGLLSTGSDTASSASSAGGGGGEEDSSGILAAIKNILTEYGKIDADPRTNSLIITDLPERFAIIEEVIAKLDNPMPQVMIEVEVLDVNKSKIDELGIKWPTAIAKLEMSGTRATSFPFGGFDNEHKPSTSGLSFDGVKTPGGTLEYSGAANNYIPTVMKLVNAELALNLLVTDKDTKFLARPRIMTMSNETAEIKITSDEVIGIKRETTTEESQSNTTEEAERGETGISLRVTPQVDLASRDITMFIMPSVTESKASSVASASGNTFRDLEVRSTKSTVRMKDGETLVIGGLIRHKEEDERNKVPFFSTVPFIGALFRNKSHNAQDRELIVFITPHILSDSEAGITGSWDTSFLKMGLDRQQTLTSRDRQIETLLKQYELE